MQESPVISDIGMLVLIVLAGIVLFGYIALCAKLAR